MAIPVRNPEEEPQQPEAQESEDPSGSVEDFREWWMHLYPRLLGRASRLSGPSEASDIVQDVAVLALRKLQREERFPFPDQEAFDKWAYSCLRYRALDRLRAAARGKQLNESKTMEPFQEPPQHHWVTLRHGLSQALRSLPERQQAVMRALVAGQTTTEIANDLGIEEATVRSLRRYARRHLVKFFEENDVGQARRRSQEHA